MPDLTVTFTENQALTLRTAAKAQIRSLRRKLAHHNGTDLNTLDVEHLEDFVRKVEDVFPPLSPGERELIRDLRHASYKVEDIEVAGFANFLATLAARGKVCWHETRDDTIPHHDWPAPPGAWIALA